jgi:glutaredoxin
MSNIILYSTGCPKCNVLKKKLDNSGMDYAEENNVKIMEELGIDAVPVLKVDDKMLSYLDAVNYVNNGGNIVTNE